MYRVIFGTKLSMLKIVDGGEFDVSKRTVAATKLQDGDEVVSVAVWKEQTNIVLQTAGGYFLRFPIEEILEKKKVIYVTEQQWESVIREMKMEYAATLPKALDMARKWTGSEEVTVIPNGISVYAE